MQISQRIGSALCGVRRLECVGDDHGERGSEVMHILEHLFLVGEFPERAHLL